MVDFTKRTAVQQILLKYYEIYWLRVFNTILYFTIEFILFVMLSFLPIKIIFYYEISSQVVAQRTLDIIFLFLFTMHIYLYLDHKIRKLVQNPQITKKILFQTYIIKLKWLNVFNTQFVYDIICLLIAIYQLADESNDFIGRMLEIVYLLKIYKIKVFHDRFQSYIIGTPFYIVYNIFYGLFILIIIVSYVGCGFFQLDKYLNDSNYKYPDLLWVNVSAWPDIIGSGFNIQLLYTMYWSLGTASSAAYGNVSASAPEDIIYNIICLYFEGFLFGFYLSRIHSLPQILSKKEDQLLQIFQQFQQHKQQIKKSDLNEKVQQQLYFKILCSLQYQEYRKKNVNQIQKLLPVQYLIQIKAHVFKNLLHANPLNLWTSNQLRNKLCLKIQQTTTQAGEQLYEYKQISHTDLIYIRQGQITTSIQIDHATHFSTNYKNFKFFGMFQFITGFPIQYTHAQCNNYCNLYIIKRQQYKQLLTLQQKIEFQGLFTSTISFENQIIQEQSIGQFSTKLQSSNTNKVLFSSNTKCDYFAQVLKEQSQRNKHKRKFYRRSNCRPNRYYQKELPRCKSIGIQCCEQINNLQRMDEVIIL